MSITKKDLQELAGNIELLEVARLAIENELVEWRDSRLFTLRNNGFTIMERDGTPSSIIRFGPETGLRIALQAMAEKL